MYVEKAQCESNDKYLLYINTMDCISRRDAAWVICFLCVERISFLIKHMLVNPPDFTARLAGEQTLLDKD